VRPAARTSDAPCAFCFPEGRLTTFRSPTDFFCAAFDICMAVYFYLRRAQWIVKKPNSQVT
jgi:hypothetical protein